MACNDNEALINRMNSNCLYGNYGLHAGMSIMLETRKIKSQCSKMTFKWVKGHQDDVPFDVSPETHVNNECDQLANVERENKMNIIDIKSLNLNVVIE